MALACYLPAATSHAQTPNAHTWHNRISRIVPACDSIPGTRGEKTLAGMLCLMAMDGKIKAYDTYNSSMELAVNPDSIRRRFYHSDTVRVYDPVDQVEYSHVSKSDPYYNGIGKWRIVEDWDFDMYSGKIIVRPQGIAPVDDIYDEQGSYRGSRSLYWFRWSDVKDIIARYNTAHPNCDMFARHYNVLTGMGTTAGKATETHYYQLHVQLADTADYSGKVRAEIYEPSLTERITNAVKKGTIKPWKWSGASFTAMQQGEFARAITPVVDTIIVTDPVTRDEITKVVSRDFDLNVPDYKVMLECKYDKATSATTMTITAIAPAQAFYDEKSENKEYRPVYWVKYADALPFLQAEPLQNPNIDFAISLWDGLFRK